MIGLETLRQAWKALKGNFLRSLLTLSIIAFGIMAVVGILTAIDAAIYSINDNFSSLGANSISIKAGTDGIRTRDRGRVQKAAEPIVYEEALLFEELFKDQGTVALSLTGSRGATVTFKQEETNPTVQITGIDDDYLEVKSLDVVLGRGFSAQETTTGANIAIIGSDIVDKLFQGNSAAALGKIINAGKLRLEVIGVLEEKGTSAGSSTDQAVFAPLQTVRRGYGTANSSYSITVALPSKVNLDNGVSEATGAMRVARGLSARQPNDFTMDTSDSLLEEINNSTSMLQTGAIAIGAMTLFGAAIGLMNIMLVSVTERTREIGIIKALGASSQTILFQFLLEAIIIAQAGGIVGIIFGIIIGNIVALLAGGEFLIPWGWIAISYIVCLITGLISGFYPAYRASILDPIESLRYE